MTVIKAPSTSPETFFPGDLTVDVVADTTHAGTNLILRHFRHPADVVTEAAEFVWDFLYADPLLSPVDTGIDASPPQRSRITLHIRPFDGVAHTINHKELGTAEIHLSSTYFWNNAQVPGRSYAAVKAEILGVLVHEMVHVWQFNSNGVAPGGLIEGIADLVRLRAGYAPPHWQRKKSDPSVSWDAGYDTTAYFLDWIETRVNVPYFTQRLNAVLAKGHVWRNAIFADLTGHPVEALWDLYQSEL